MDTNRNNENSQLIKEALSISDEVTATSDRIYADIEDNIQNYPYGKLKDGLVMRKGSIMYKLWGFDIKAEFIIYDFDNEELFNNEKETLNYVNLFNPKTRTLYLTLVALLGSIYRPNSEDAIHHEVEHAYQWCLNKSKNPNFKVLVDAAYNYALKILNSSQNDTECNLAWVIYYANPREQDAFANEYYVQSKQSMQKFVLDETEVDERLRYFEEVVGWLDTNFSNPQVQQYMKAYKTFGYNPNNIMTYARKGLTRFKNKLSHVRKLINMTTNERMPINAHRPIDKTPKNNEAIIHEITDSIIEKLRRM